MLCGIAASTIVIAVLLTSPGFDTATTLLLIAFILTLFAVACVAAIYETVGRYSVSMR